MGRFELCFLLVFVISFVFVFSKAYGVFPKGFYDASVYSKLSFATFASVVTDMVSDDSFVGKVVKVFYKVFYDDGRMFSKIKELR
ncbi:MAG: hypothetical protein ABDH28_02190 [Brevinematia bacterium]